MNVGSWWHQESSALMSTSIFLSILPSMYCASGYLQLVVLLFHFFLLSFLSFRCCNGQLGGISAMCIPFISRRLAVHCNVVYIQIRQVLNGGCFGAMCIVADQPMIYDPPFQKYCDTSVGVLIKHWCPCPSRGASPWLCAHEQTLSSFVWCYGDHL